MRLIQHAAVLAAALLCGCAISPAVAQTWPGTGPGVFPTIATVVGGERIPAQDTNGVTVDIEPVQLAQYLAASGAIFSFLPSPLVNGSCLSTNGTVLIWQPCGFGTVTSVAVTLPSWLTVSGSPITSAGILAVTAAPSQPAGQVLATPALATGAVGLRALVATDIPPVNLAGAGNGGVFGVLPIANGGTGTQTPSLIGGTNCTVTGAWPNQTVNCTAPAGGTGTVTTVSVAAANGLSGTVSSPTTTPVITLAPTFSGLVDSNGAGFAPATSAAIIGLWSGTCNSTTFLRGDGTCQTGGGGGGGTVTSVGISMPSIFTVTGSPVTGAGNFNVVLASQSANQVLASPNGSSGTPSYRALVAADIPTVLNGLTSASSLATVGTITSGVWNGSVLAPIYGGSGEAGTVTGILKANGASAYSAAASGDVLGLWSGTCNSSTYLRGDGSCQAPPGGGSVSSVGLTTPAWLTVVGSPITGAGTLAVTGTSEPANQVLASPNGTAGALAPRALVVADIPTLNQNTTGTAANITATSNSTLTTLSALSLPSSQITGLGTFAAQNYATPPAIGATTPAAGTFTAIVGSSIVDSGLTTGTSPVCPNGTGGALTTVGCAGGGGSGTVTDGSGTTTASQFLLSTTTVHTYSVTTAAQAQAALVAANAKTYTPTLASGATNDWDPTAGSITTLGFANTTPNAAGSTVDGIVAGSDQQEFTLCNSAALGSSNSWILLENQSASETTAANRLAGAGNVVLAPQACVDFLYSTSVSRWIMGRVADAGTGAIDALASGTSMTPDCSFWAIKETASATGTFTINAPTDCAPQPEQKMLLEITSPAGGTITYSWNAAFVASATTALPTTSNAASKEDDFIFYWSASKSAWKFQAANQGF